MEIKIIFEEYSLQVLSTHTDITDIIFVLEAAIEQLKEDTQ